MAGYTRLGCWAAPAAVILAPDGGSGVEALRGLFDHPRTTWTSASEAEALEAMSDILASSEPLAVWLRQGAEDVVVIKAAALAWREQRRISS